MDVTPSSVGLSLFMPPANQTSVGTDAMLRNLGAVSFIVKDFTGSTIVSIAPGASYYIYVTTNLNTAGTWGIIAYGIGSSGADAATLAGYGLLASGVTLNAAQPVTTFSSTLNVYTGLRSSVQVFTGGAGTVTLSSTTSLGNNFFFSLRNSGTGTLTVTPQAGDYINGVSSITLQPGDSCIVSCSGSGFYTVGLGKSTQFNFTILTKAVTSGTYTLTSSEASNVIQKYTGTLTGNVTIVVPPTVQVYYVENATSAGSGGYTITITTGIAGSSGATITANNQATLICDSTNLVNANTVLAGLSVISLSDGSVGSPSLAFTSETTTGIYRPASGQLAIAILGALGMVLSASGMRVPNGISGGSF